MATLQEIKDNQALESAAIDAAVVKIQTALANIPLQADIDAINQTVLDQTAKINAAVAQLP